MLFGVRCWIGHGAALIAALLLFCPALAQTPTDPPAVSPENVVVTDQALSREQIETFVDHYAAAAARLDKLARWKRSVCPVTLGLPAEQNLAISARIREVANLTGAGTPAKGQCRPRIVVIFTAEPQALMDYIKHKYPYLLGRHYYAQTDSVATISSAAKAWYGTETQDASGRVQSDYNHYGHPIDGQGFSATGLAHHDGLSSQFQSVLVVVDLNEAQGHKVGALADYAAFMSLAQTRQPETCEGHLTVLNLLNKACLDSQRANSLTNLDLAYLKGLYRASEAASFASQKGSIARQIESDLGVH